MRPTVTAEEIGTALKKLYGSRLVEWIYPGPQTTDRTLLHIRFDYGFAVMSLAQMRDLLKEG